MASVRAVSRAGRKWVEVKQIGPAEIDGGTLTDFFPIMNKGCTLCP